MLAGRKGEEPAEGCLKGRVVEGGGGRSGKGGKCRIRCDIVNATVN